MGIPILLASASSAFIPEDTPFSAQADLIAGSKYPPSHLKPGLPFLRHLIIQKLRLDQMDSH